MTGNKSVVEKRFEYHGYPCVIIFQPIGHRCGYVGLSKDDKYFGMYYEEIDIDCHGGLTYASDNLYDQLDENTWWIGFDCAHAGDAKDFESLRKYYPDERSMEMFKFWEDLDRKYPDDSVVRDLAYVERQCRYIVDQLCGIAEEELEPPMLIGNILIPIDDWKAAKEALKEETLWDDQRTYQILNYIFQITLEHAKEV